MQDRIVETPNRYMLVPVEGEENQFDLYPVPGTVTQAGTPLTKANLLSDTTAGKYVATADVPESTPDDVLDLLATALVWDGTKTTDVKGNIAGIQIATGSYTGTGAYGSTNPNSITCDFVPKLLIIGGTTIWYDSMTSYETYNAGSSQYVGTAMTSFTWGTTTTWYFSGFPDESAAQNAAHQLNSSGAVYSYIAIG